ncbi:MAG: AMP-binding protein [Myxococcota bacterium]|nr:AMP-binding protein [Myxococcota bacterium]
MNALPLTLPGRLLAQMKIRADTVALREKKFGIWHEFTWADYGHAVAEAAAAVMLHGVEPGDHIAILSENRSEWLFADLGAQSVRARSVGIYQTNPVEDVTYIVEHCRAKLVFCEDQEQVDKLLDPRAELPTLRHIIVFDPRGLRTVRDDRLMTWSDFLEQGAGHVRNHPHWWAETVAGLEPDEPAMVVYTSGTTGQPKGAMLSGRNALGIADDVSAQLNVGPEDALLSYLPLCHVAEKIFTYFIPLVSGAVVHFGESIDTVRQDLVEVSPSVFLGVPRIWEKMHATIVLKMKDSSWLKRTLFHWATRCGARTDAKRRQKLDTLWDRLLYWFADCLIFRALQERLGLRRCRLPYSGAAPISPDLLTWFHGIGVPIYEGFGQTESAGLISMNLPGQVRIGSVGRALPGTQVRLADDGEVLASGPHVFAGYLHNDEATQRTVDESGWLHTGDIGRLDDDGYLYITGRKKEIIITAGGKNLSPEKIENALKMSPFIKESVAIGDRRKFVSALIQIDWDATGDWATRRGLAYTSFEDLASKDAVRALIKDEINAANERLARVEQVRAFRLLNKELHQDDGEMTATQKVRRRAVTDKFEALVLEMYGGPGG